MKSYPMRTRTANGAECMAEEAGSVCVKMMGVEYEIQNVLYAPWATGNILSLHEGPLTDESEFRTSRKIVTAM
ncbi:hypothetical protein NDN08_003519 [Rhodosorus marinus]|uniref:Retrovirus-related Pol polyprotein from transposon TNT 1-94-like beta-barrel domain-containing protein n=1 Tax=Rhodosorus marinus TaxID=101924 RepID=A0AAV8UZM2_9RHOD|nr:hypothetical protein NDN08_003519 [Rhodosorus marinus]